MTFELLREYTFVSNEGSPHQNDKNLISLMKLYVRYALPRTKTKTYLCKKKKKEEIYKTRESPLYSAPFKIYKTCGRHLFINETIHSRYVVKRSFLFNDSAMTFLY